MLKSPPASSPSNGVFLTIANSQYALFANRFAFSLRDAGWRGEIHCLTEEDGFHVAGMTMHHVTIPKYGQKVFTDNRWLQFDLDLPFVEGQRVVYLDADMVVLPSFPFDTIFDHDFACATTYDGAKEMPIVSRLLSGQDTPTKYIASPFAFKVDAKTRRFFSMCRLFCHMSVALGRGTMVPFNLACYTIRRPEVIGEGLCPQWEDVRGDSRDDVGRNLSPFLETAWCIHYGGHKFKDFFMSEYATLKHHNEIL